MDFFKSSSYFSHKIFLFCVVYCNRWCMFVSVFIVYIQVTEKPKVEDLLKWIGLMNNIQVCVDEIVLMDIVYFL